MMTESQHWMLDEGDLLEELTDDHAELVRLFSALLGVPIGDPERKRMLDRATVMLVAHDAIEEACLYPTLRARVPEGAQIADSALRDHAQTDVQLRRLQPLDQLTPGFDRQLALLRAHVTGHIGWEDALVFPLLRDHVPKEQLDALGREVRARRMRAPHTPASHPGVQPPSDPFTPPQRSFRERLHYLFTPVGGWHRAPR